MNRRRRRPQPMEHTAFSLSGKTALVTGGGRGLGKAIVLALAQAGAEVAFCYQRDARSAQAVAEAVAATTERLPLFVQANVTVEDDRRRLMEEVSGRLGRLDILVNNAGTREDGIAVRMGGAWDKVIELDLSAPFRMSQHVLKMMIKQSWGRIINIGSVASRIGLAGQANYTAAKAGLEGMTRSLAQEYGKRGITVNTVNPGFIETDLTEDASEEFRRWLLERAAIPRLVTPEAVASVVAFLATDAAWAITGQAINVDCGLVKL